MRLLEYILYVVLHPKVVRKINSYVESTGTSINSDWLQLFFVN